MPRMMSRKNNLDMQPVDNTDAFEAAAKRIKERRGIPPEKKIKIPLDEVFEEMKNG